MEGICADELALHWLKVNDCDESSEDLPAFTLADGSRVDRLVRSLNARRLRSRADSERRFSVVVARGCRGRVE